MTMIDDVSSDVLHAGLYIVATPIGNLNDITLRAVNILRRADLVLAEDTRHSKRLFLHHGINCTELKSCHEHNEAQRESMVGEYIAAGKIVALISDAGTPLINDPGYRLVSYCRQNELAVFPVPGASSVICALSAAGLPTDRFCFEGFVPAKQSHILKTFLSMAEETRTMVWLVPTKSIRVTLECAIEAFGSERAGVVARELTKKFETFLYAPVGELFSTVCADENQQKGEFVLVIAGAIIQSDLAIPDSVKQLAKALMNELPPKKIATILSEQFSLNKKQIYEWVVETKNAAL